MNVRTNKTSKSLIIISKKGIYNVINRMLIRLLPLNSLVIKLQKATQMVEMLMWIMPIYSECFLSFSFSLLIADIYVYHYKGC